MTKTIGASLDRPIFSPISPTEKIGSGSSSPTCPAISTPKLGDFLEYDKMAFLLVDYGVDFKTLTLLVVSVHFLKPFI